MLAGERTERELQLEKELADERAARKNAEMDAAQLLDENQRLKTPTPATKKKVRAFGIHFD